MDIHYLQRGLRTLVFGMRRLDPLEYSKLASEMKSARGLLDLTAREEKLSEVFNSLEQGLHIQGASAVEDRLQERVPETLELLQAAGIKVKEKSKKPTGYLYSLIVTQLSNVKIGA